MCGIAGIFGNTNTDSITSMVSCMQHRGGDGNGIYIDDKIALGHSRLAIIDLSDNAKQPIFNEDGSMMAVINGEIYNYKALREDLQLKGHTFRSDCDSEVIMHAYEQYRDNIVNRLSGMFALAIYDKTEDRLVLARDPIGKKPLYYCWKAGTLYFASEIKAILKCVQAEVNHEMLSTYLMYQYSMGNETLFKGIKKLAPGCMMVAKENGYLLRRYWHFNDDPVTVWPNQETDRRLICSLRSRLEQSVRARLQSDVPVGAFLSGGIDSSAVVALWRDQSNADIHTFTASFEGHSEAKYADMVSMHLQTKYHEVPITGDMVARDFSRITWHHDEPLGDAAVINNYYLAQEARKYVKVVLAGEGGDELFGGYPWYKYAPYISIANLVPEQIRHFGQLLLLGDGNPLKWHGIIDRVLAFPLQRSMHELILYPETSMSCQNLSWLTGKKSYYLRYQAHTRGRPVWDIKGVYNKMLAMDCLNLLPEKYLMKADKATMAHALEERLPLLDKDIIQYAFSLPTHLKKDKYILRKAVEDLLPSEIVWRKKAGFGTPVAEWLNNPQMRLITMHCLRDGKLLKEICIPERLSKLGKYVMDGKLKSGGALSLNVSGMIWNLVALQVWHDRYFGGE